MTAPASVAPASYTPGPGTPAPAAVPAAAPTAAAEVWPAWQRALFRFAFAYVLLYIAPWTLLDDVPGIGAVTGLYTRLDQWAVEAANARWFHVRPVLVAPNGSGDTSAAWAGFWLHLALAAVAAAVWTLADRRRRAYPRLLYWTRTLVRYWIAAAALGYGIIKLFALQMQFPTLSQLATPLGDFLPMRLSWMFLGYSTRYQVFSGAVETVAGLLLLRRNTVTLGLMVAAGAFLNVALINLSYDVPVKLFALHLLAGCTFLLALDAPRLYAFFVRNEAVPGTRAYEPRYRHPRHRYVAWAAKGLFILLLTVVPTAQAWSRYRALVTAPEARPFRPGVYDVRRFVRNGDTVATVAADALRWRDVIFDDGKAGSIATADTAFWQRYGRAYFRYAADTARGTATVWRTSTRMDSVAVGTWRYALAPGAAGRDTIRLWTRLRGDSVFAELVRTDRHFQLAERQFHWLSEYNR